MKAIILAAGLGTRLLPLTKNKPKVMLEIGSKPLLWHQIEWLKKFGVREIGINLYHKPESIKKFFGDGQRFGVKIDYSLEKEILGTGGALLPFKKFLDKTFFLVYGDVFHRVDLKKLLAFHRRRKGLITLVSRTTDHPEDSDLIDRTHGGKVIKFHAKPHKKLPKTRLANTSAAYVVEPQALDYIPKGFADFDREIIVKLVETHPVYAYLKSDSEYVQDIGNPLRYQKVQKDYRGWAQKHKGVKA